MSRAAILAFAVALPCIVAAAPPSALAGVAGGMWEISGVSGSPTPVRQCVSDILSLGQFEHRGRSCARAIVSNGGNSILVQYNCGSAGFGRSQIDVVTPRSLTISTQ